MPSNPEIRSLESAYIAPRQDGPERLLVVLHGLGDSIEGYRFLPKILNIPGLHYLLVNAPEPYFTGYSWFDIYGDIPSGVERSRKILFEAVEEIHAGGWEYRNIGFFGFSQGCVMTLELACRYPEVFGAMVGVSGFVARLQQYPEAFSPVARSQKIFVTHGTQDPMLPLEPSRKQIYALQGMGLKLDFKIYEKEHSIDPRQEVGDIRSFLLRTLSSGQ